MTFAKVRHRLRTARLETVAAFAMLAAVGMAVSAHATLRAITAGDDRPIASAPPALGYEAEDHFPGAANFYVTDDDAAPARGVTGTTALPDLPTPAGAAFEGDATIRPAQPFSTRLATTVDRGRALQCLTAAIYYEAASESDDGQRAVAQVILNRVRHPAFPATVCGVVYQGTERASGCQFSYACDGSMTRAPSRTGWNRAIGIAAQALAGYVFAPVGLATHYHTYAVTPAWNRGMVMTAAIGAHFFHRWQGYWGTAAAFRQGYAGGEPVPGPHPKLDAPLAAPVILAASAAPVAAAMVQPAYVSSAALATSAPVDTLPESTVLDKWKDSGKPLK